MPSTMDQSLHIEKENLRDLITSERYYRDTRKWADLRQCYHPDPSQTRVAVTWIDDTIDTFITAAKQLADWGENPLHSITAGMVHIHDNRAVIVSPCIITLRFMENGKEYDFTSHVRLVHQCQKVEFLPSPASGSAWKVLSLRTIYIQDAVAASSPVREEDLVVDTGSRRPSYKHLCWLLERRGFEIRDDLPGVDRLDLMEREMEVLFAWLFAE
ncbi:hypothetical protein BJY04DRAFT_187656 [Aspergillus karnatakaensis]|uniref:uncharacterized protein n=1 Tax=Aspergillus karnatakaensis TaxID=1810916 RepID=UPI003CCDC211